jgi:hypothetical protein
MAWQLCDKSDVIDIFPATESELLDSWSDMVEALIRQHLGEAYLGTSQAVVSEYHNGDGSSVLRVSKPPIISVSALRINDVALLATDYGVFEGIVQLRYETFPAGVLNVEVDYVSGSTAVDYTVRLAAASMIVAIINYRRRHGADASLKWSGGEQKTGEETPNQDLGLTSHLAGIMKQVLRRPRVRVS